MTISDHGFVKVGEWWLDPGLGSGIRCVLTSLVDVRVVYAILVQTQVRYIGICERSTTTLSDRMGRYQSCAGAGTNKRIAGKMRSCLDAGQTVEVWALRPDATFLYAGISVDLVKGLENPLIELFHPEWNAC